MGLPFGRIAPDFDSGALEDRVNLLGWVADTRAAQFSHPFGEAMPMVGFGLDSTVEVMSAMVIVWQFRGLAEDRERRALKLIAVSFFGLAAYVAVQAIVDLVGTSRPESSPVGIGLAFASFVVMPLLARSNGITSPRQG